ncbi:MAG: hypothetical protein ABIQ15_13000 [Nocardioides sp.]
MTSPRFALRDLAVALDAPHRPGASLGRWRWSVRQQLAGVRDLLVSESTQHENAWLAARGGTVLRERNTLLARLSAVGPRVLEAEEVAPVRIELTRLVGDIHHHLQRVHDLAYDEVELELGGSE